MCCANSPPALLFSYMLFSSRGEKKAPVRRVADTQSQWGRAAAAVQVLNLPPSRRVAKCLKGGAFTRLTRCVGLQAARVLLKVQEVLGGCGAAAAPAA